MQQVMPNHVVPIEYYLVIPLKIEAEKQNSLITMLVSVVINLPRFFHRQF